MKPPYPTSWAGLRYPWQRAELLHCLEELTVPDPRYCWAAERLEGIVSGVEEVIHFFFDDHDFDEGDVGLSLLDHSEVTLVRSVKQELDKIMQQLPHGSEDDYVTHAHWRAVTAAAVAAHAAMNER